MGVIKDIDRLNPELAQRTRYFLQELKKKGIEVVVVETERTVDTQLAYYVQGRKPLAAVNDLRKKAGLYLLTEAENKRIVTKTTNSRHFGGNAVDIAPVKDRRIWWNAPEQVWQEIGTIGEECGLDWCAGGYGQVWGKGWDSPHFELMK